MTTAINEAEFAASEALGAAPDIAGSEWVVLKFGGSSVATAANWRTIAGVIRNRLDAGLRPVVVHSAIAGATNALQRILAQAAAGGGDAERTALEERYRGLATDLGLDGDALLAPYFEQLEQTAAGVRLVREVSPRIEARTLALGELMASALGAGLTR